MTGGGPVGESDDEAALTWDVDDDPTLIESTARRRRPIAPPEAEPDADEYGDEAPSSSALGLVVSGVLVGVYALETLGWLLGVLGSGLAATVDPGTGSALDVLGIVLNLGGRVAAVLGPAAWLLVAVRGFAGRGRLAWVVLGAVVLIPWPALVHA